MKDVIVGVDAGTSVIKSVAFDLNGRQLGVSAVDNTYSSGADGAVEQDMEATWTRTLSTLRGLRSEIDGLEHRLAAIAITGQGDGTWLIDEHGQALAPAWLWLDARAGELAAKLSQQADDQMRFSITGTGLNACQQGPQLAWLMQHRPELLRRSSTAFHCKDWLYFKLTGERVTDPSEGCFTFGDFRTREYSDDVLRCLGLQEQRRLLPPMLDGASQSLPLTDDAAAKTGLLAGTPIVLGYVDIICTALGAGLYDPVESPGCTIVGSTGVHMGLCRHPEKLQLNDERTGYTMPMPVAGVSAQIQTNMASTLNIDWLLDTAVSLIRDYQSDITRRDLIKRVDEWLAHSEPSGLVFHPYISDAGERGPFIDSRARASFIGLNAHHGFADLIRSVVEGLAFAAVDCYRAMGNVPSEIRLTGGAARSQALRRIFGNSLGTRIRTIERQEAGAAGAAMMASVAIGHFTSMDECVRQWVRPLLGEPEMFDQATHELYQQNFENYLAARRALRPVWHHQANPAS